MIQMRHLIGRKQCHHAQYDHLFCCWTTTAGEYERRTKSFTCMFRADWHHVIITSVPVQRSRKLRLLPDDRKPLLEATCPYLYTHISGTGDHLQLIMTHWCGRQISLSRLGAPHSLSFRHPRHIYEYDENGEGCFAMEKVHARQSGQPPILVVASGVVGTLKVEGSTPWKESCQTPIAPTVKVVFPYNGLISHS